MIESFKEGCRVIAVRMANAENDFYENIMDISGCSKLEAEKVLSVYLKFNVAKIDPVMGRVNVKHGVFYEKDVIENAISFKEE